MSWYITLAIAVGLSTDAFAISVAKGAVSRSLDSLRALYCGARIRCSCDVVFLVRPIGDGVVTDRFCERIPAVHRACHDRDRDAIDRVCCFVDPFDIE